MMLLTKARVLALRLLEGVRRASRDDRLSEEIETHLELLTNDLIAKGLSLADARTAARRAFGAVDQLKFVYRDQRGLPVLEALAQDVRFAVRLLRRDGGFTITAVFVLGIGIGVNNMFFTILNAHTLRGLPIARASRVVYISTFDDRNRDRGLSVPDFVDLGKGAHTVASLAAFTNGPATVAGDGSAADRLTATFLSANAFDLIGIRPVFGRGFEADDERPESTPVVMLGNGVWRARYGGDREVIGRSVLVNGVATTIIGVVPDRSGFPTTADIWLPLQQVPGFSTRDRSVRTLRVLALVRDDIALSRATAQITTVVEGFPRDDANANTKLRARVVPVDEQFFGRLSDPAWQAFIAAGFLVVLISCANAANLMLAHSMGRAREFAIRTSLGATRRRILRQLLIEAVVLAAAGGTVGFGVSVASVRLFRSAIPQNALPYWTDYSVDARVLAALGLVSLLTVLVFALLPAVQASKADVNVVLKDGGRPSGGRRHSRRWTTVFLTAEFALAVVLLSQVVESIRDAGPPLPSDLVINTKSVITGAVTLPAASYIAPQQRVDGYQRLTEGILAIPGVVSASMTSVLPLTGGPDSPVRVASGPRASAEAIGTAHTVAIGPGYFRTLGVPLVRGRDFAKGDGTPAHAFAIVNERFCEKVFSGENPIGQQIELLAENTETRPGPFTIVGVAPDIRQRPSADPDPVVYLPYLTSPPATLSLIVRTDLDASRIVPLMRREVLAVDSNLPVYRIQTMTEVVRNADWNRRLSHVLVLFITFIAVALSTVGLYAVTAHGVSQRTQEIGVRMALGAPSWRVVLVVVRRVFVQLSFGLVAGIVCARVWERMFGSADAEMKATDPQSLAAIAATLAFAALIASFVPARRATRLDPVAAIRGD